jgi:hypothetical protein
MKAGFALPDNATRARAVGRKALARRANGACARRDGFADVRL